MGEWSKKIGEVGEEIVYEFLSLIGWGDAQKGIEISCIHGLKHKEQQSPKKTHGIDYFLSLHSQLVNRTLDHLVISVKYSESPYPSSPVTKFKDHFGDLAKTIECFKKSQLRIESNLAVSSIDQSRDIGVLFWLTNKDSSDDDIISKIATSRRIEDYVYDIIYLVDNNRISFIYDTIKHIKAEFTKSKVEFFYPNTGRNFNPSNRESSGDILPVEYINSSILPIKITNTDGTKSLVISTIEEFHKDRLKRLIGLAQELSLNLTKNTIILFPNYNDLNHQNDVQATKNGFKDKSFTKTVTVNSFRKDFRGAKNA